MGETTLLDIQSDFIFKRVFGAEKNKRLLISLINSILKGNPQVNNIEIRNSELSKILKGNRTIHLDIKAEIGFQKFVNIEMQVRNTGEIMERAVQHLAEVLTLNSRRLTDEEKDAGKRQTYKYPKVIGIWIMGENVTDRKDAINEACLSFPPTERDDYQIMTDKLRIFFVELRKFHPKHLDRKNMLDVWMTFLKDPLDTEIQDVSEVRQALDTLKEVSEDEETREIYYLRQQTEFGYISEKNVAVEKALREGEKVGIEKGKAEGEKIGEARGIEKGKAEGKAEGEKIGIEKGAREKAIETAKNALALGLQVEQIAKISGLSVKEIEQLR